MRPESRKLLEDMRAAVEGIASFAKGKSLDDYNADKQLRWAIERGFEIVGEALTRLNRFDTNLAARIQDHRKIISFRNILIHGYSQVNPARTWDIVQNDIPKLMAQLSELLA